jgi:hypothetical protein
MSKKQIIEKIEGLEEYWNRSHNNTATHDALYHILDGINEIKNDLNSHVLLTVEQWENLLKALESISHEHGNVLCYCDYGGDSECGIRKGLNQIRIIQQNIQLHKIKESKK